VGAGTVLSVADVRAAMSSARPGGWNWHRCRACLLPARRSPPSTRAPAH
jgi:hypothetical protein